MNDLNTACDADFLFKYIINTIRSDFEEIKISDKAFKVTVSDFSEDE